MLMLYGNPKKKAETIWKQQNLDFNGPAVSLSSTLKFGGVGMVGPLREMPKKMPTYVPEEFFNIPYNANISIKINLYQISLASHA